MASELLHEPAMRKIGSSLLDRDAIGRALQSLAKVADESNANVAATTISFVEDNEEVAARYVPQITFRVCQPNSLGD